ncbi:MAG: hypothetical protein R3D29_05205 [Nitratireductor sp.]
MLANLRNTCSTRISALPDQDAADPVRHPVIIVGAGPVGLAAAIDLAQRDGAGGGDRRKRQGVVRFASNLLFHAYAGNSRPSRR